MQVTCLLELDIRKTLQQELVPIETFAALQVVREPTRDLNAKAPVLAEIPGREGNRLKKAIAFVAREVGVIEDVFVVGHPGGVCLQPNTAGQVLIVFECLEAAVADRVSIDRLSRNPLSTPAQLQMLIDGLYGDQLPLRQDLGIEPREFSVETIRELQTVIPPLFGFSLRLCCH